MLSLKNRKIFTKIKPFLERDEIIIINGVRQVGKTSLLKIIKKHYQEQNISPDNLIYLNLEDFETLNFLNQNPKNLVNYLNNEKKHFFFIDEIQYLDDPSHFLKYIYDFHRSQIKLIVTGSSVLEIKAKLQDSLVGRKISFHLEPLIFEEFLEFKNFNLKKLDKETLTPQTQRELNNFLNEYLVFGSLPQISLENDNEIKKKLLKEYIATYINKDIRAIGQITDINKFNNLLKVLSGQIGNLLNINEINNTLDINSLQIEKYLNLLQYTFVLKKIAPYFTNIRKEISKMNKIYFFDLGVRNAILGNFLPLENRTDSGALFENFVYQQLDFYADKIHFYRTLSKTEIDFIAHYNNQLYPIEVKAKDLKKKIALRGLLNFIQKNNLKTGYLLNKSFNQQIEQIRYLDYLQLNKLFK